MSGRELSAKEIGYIAGMIDGEGSLELCRYMEDPPRYQIRLVIANTNREALDFLRERIGGSIRMRKRQKTHHRDVYILALNANRLRWLLPQISGSLIVKRQQADVLLEALVLTARREGCDLRGLKRRITELNHRGNPG